MGSTDRWTTSSLECEWRRADLRLCEGTKHTSASAALRVGNSLYAVQRAIPHRERAVRSSPFRLVRWSVRPSYGGTNVIVLTQTWCRPLGARQKSAELKEGNGVPKGIRTPSRPQFTTFPPGTRLSSDCPEAAPRFPQSEDHGTRSLSANGVTRRPTNRASGREGEGPGERSADRLRRRPKPLPASPRPSIPDTRLRAGRP